MAGKSDFFFYNLLNGDDRDILSDTMNSCKVDISSEALELIIAFCYSGCVELTMDNVESVLVGAKELQIESLTVVCTEMLEEALNIDNCIRILAIADTQQLDLLREITIEMIADELPHINRLPEFFHLNGSQMFWLIQLVSSCHHGVFNDLLKSWNDIERLLSTDIDSERQSSVRAAVSFIAFFLLLLYFFRRKKFKTKSQF